MTERSENIGLLVERNKPNHQEVEPGAVKNRYLTSKEASKYLSVSERHLFNLRSEGKVKYYQAGKLIRFKKEDLDAYLEVHVMDLIPTGKEVRNG